MADHAFAEGATVYCFDPIPGRARILYEAKVSDSDVFSKYFSTRASYSTSLLSRKLVGMLEAGNYERSSYS